MKTSLFRVGVSVLLSAVIFPGCLVVSGETLLNGFFEGDNGEGDYLEGDGSSCEGGDLIVAGLAWQGFDFIADNVATPCNGARFIRFDEEYGLYVGVSLCDDDQYKIFLGDSLDRAFHQVGDYAGHGQDHCELVNPNFDIPNEDDITSGGCADCDTGTMYIWDSAPIGTLGYRRGYFGEPFELIDWQDHMGTVEWYRCGVSFDAECDDPGEGEDPNGGDPGTGGCDGEEPVCGNGILEADEECDDGNNSDGDGCAAECQIEVGCGDPAEPDK